MAHQNAAQDEDMSMDEILASIRRYVTGDGGSPTHAPSDVHAKPKVVHLTSDDEWLPSSPHQAPIESRTVDRNEGIISDTARVSTQKAFQKMEQLRDLQNMTRQPSGGKSMDDFMMELLKPLLKQWMDKHLPGLVERIVEREIQNALHPSDKA